MTYRSTGLRPVLSVNLNSQITPQHFRARIAAQFGNGLVLDLSHPFPGQVESFADIFQAHGMINSDPKKETDDFLLPLCQRFQDAVNFLFQRFLVFDIRIRQLGIRIFQHIDQGIVLPFRQRRIHAHVTCGNTEGGRDFFDIQFQQLGQFFGGRFAFKLLFQLRIGFLDTVGKAYLVQGKPNDPGLLGQRLQNALTNPPYSIGNEFETPGFIKTLCGLDQSQIAFIDEIRQGKPWF